MSNIAKRLIILSYCIISFLWLAFTNKVFNCADSSRFIEGTGSEILYPIVPFVILIFLIKYIKSKE